MELINIIAFAMLIAMLYDIRRDIRLNQQSLERITNIANDIHRKTDEILNRLPRQA